MLLTGIIVVKNVIYLNTHSNWAVGANKLTSNLKFI
jgi:hypothetical protein